MIAAAAVRESEWALARRAALRYAEADADPLEATRLASWVEYREMAWSGSTGENYTDSPILLPLPLGSR